MKREASRTGPRGTATLARLVLLLTLFLAGPLAPRALEPWVGYVRWEHGPGAGLEHAGAPVEVLLHLRDLGGGIPRGLAVAGAACAAGDVDRDGHGDLWVLSALGPSDDAGGGMASLVSGRTERVLRRMRQVDLRASNLSIEGVGDVDADGVEDVLVGQILSSGTRLYWVRSGATGRLVLDVQRFREALWPVTVEPIARGRTRLALWPFPHEPGSAGRIVHIDPATGAPLGEAEYPPVPEGMRVEDLGDLDGDGWHEHGGWPGSKLSNDRVELVWSSGRETILSATAGRRGTLRVDTAGDVDADGVPDVLVEASAAADPRGGWRGELWVVSGAALAHPALHSPHDSPGARDERP